MNTTKRRTSVSISRDNGKLLTNIVPRYPDSGQSAIWLTCFEVVIDELVGDDVMLGFDVAEDDSMYRALCSDEEDPTPWADDYRAVYAKLEGWFASNGIIKDIECNVARAGEQYIYGQLRTAVELSAYKAAKLIREALDQLGVMVDETVCVEVIRSEYMFLEGDPANPDNWIDMDEFLKEECFNHPKRPAPACCILRTEDRSCPH